MTSVSFHVLIYYFNCALTRDLITLREQIYKFEHVFLLSALLLIISELFYSFLSVAACGSRRYPLPVAALAEANLLWIQLGTSRSTF